MFEKLPYWWSHDSMMNTIIDGILCSMNAKMHYEPDMQLTVDAVKPAIAFSHIRLARGCQYIGSQVRKSFEYLPSVSCCDVLLCRNNKYSIVVVAPRVHYISGAEHSAARTPLVNALVWVGELS